MSVQVTFTGFIYLVQHNCFHVFDVVFPDMPPVSPTSGRVEGEVKLSVSYRNSTLFIMVMHIKDLVRTDDSVCLQTDPGSCAFSNLICPSPKHRCQMMEQTQTHMWKPTFSQTPTKPPNAKQRSRGRL